jgi:hypothetical protein
MIFGNAPDDFAAVIKTGIPEVGEGKAALVPCPQIDQLSDSADDVKSRTLGRQRHSGAAFFRNKGHLASP